MRMHLDMIIGNYERKNNCVETKNTDSYRARLNVKQFGL